MAEPFLGSMAGLSFAKLTQAVLRRLAPDGRDFIFNHHFDGSAIPTDGDATSNLDFLSDMYLGYDEGINFSWLAGDATGPMSDALFSAETSCLPCLPDRSEVLRLAMFYFDHSHTLYPIVNRQEVMSDLQRIQTDQEHLLTQSPPISRYSATQRQQILKSIHQDLIEWRQSVPFPLPDLHPLVPQGCNSWYDLNFFTHLIALYRPSPLFPTLDVARVNILAEAAAMALRHANSMHMQKRLAFNWLNMLVIYNAVIALVYSVTVQPDNIATTIERSRVVEHLELATDLFKILSHKFSAANMLGTIVAQIIDSHFDAMTDVSQHKPKPVIPEKVALVTAASAGLGAHIARALAPDFRVCINYWHNATRADALIEELNSTFGSTGELPEPLDPTRFVALQADVSDRPSILRLVRDVIALFGRLDAVASNAGWTRVTDFNDIDDNMDDDLWDRTYQCNVKAHFWLMQAAKPHLEASHGAFVTTASLAGVKPGGSSVPYAISKAAQIHLVKTLSLICAPKIRVNSVSPSLMLTDWGLQFPVEQQLATREATRLKRLVTVEVRVPPLHPQLPSLSFSNRTEY
ncbi:hypothetical protein N0V83_004940 [Neocucurbitaria cava]|uniref:NAD(P)-binding protein n=1 Tax=Neocucurbitaria cava TaxID=798079 RepID=A0A9W9CLP8_9PLEO|nr:hypothetical protein N0V83_004940 [Neocucurbitaria cava]